MLFVLPLFSTQDNFVRWIPKEWSGCFVGQIGPEGNEMECCWGFFRGVIVDVFRVVATNFIFSCQWCHAYRERALHRNHDHCHGLNRDHYGLSQSTTLESMECTYQDTFFFECLCLCWNYFENPSSRPLFFVYFTEFNQFNHQLNIIEIKVLFHLTSCHSISHLHLFFAFLFFLSFLSLLLLFHILPYLHHLCCFPCTRIISPPLGAFSPCFDILHIFVCLCTWIFFSGATFSLSYDFELIIPHSITIFISFFSLFISLTSFSRPQPFSVPIYPPIVLHIEHGNIQQNYLLLRISRNYPPPRPSHFSPYIPELPFLFETSPIQKKEFPPPLLSLLHAIELQPTHRF